MTTNRRMTGQPTTKDLLGFSVGFDDLLDRLSQPNNQSYPPYNLIRVDESNQFIIEVAVAGFSKQDIKVETENGLLEISGKRNSPDAAVRLVYRHRGIAFRDFSHKFAMPDDMIVKKVSLENGLLTIVLERIVPNRHKKKVYDL